MIERCQDLPLGAQAGLHLSRQNAAADELDGDLLVILLVGALTQVHLAHPAATEDPPDLVRSDAIARTMRRGLGDLLVVGGRLIGQLAQPRGGNAVEHRLEQSRVTAACPADI